MGAHLAGILLPAILGGVVCYDGSGEIYDLDKLCCHLCLSGETMSKRHSESIITSETAAKHIKSSTRQTQAVSNKMQWLTWIEHDLVRQQCFMSVDIEDIERG